MPTIINVELRIDAPRRRVFDLARHVDVHLASATQTDEQLLSLHDATRLLKLGDDVVFQARHFGVRQIFASRIIRLDAPAYFQDIMQRGAFRSFVHDHYFIEDGDATIMRDVVTFVSPLGILGALADRLFLAEYMRAFIETRNMALKRIAESTEWHAYIQ